MPLYTIQFRGRPTYILNMKILIRKKYSRKVTLDRKLLRNGRVARKSNILVSSLLRMEENANQ